jgi:hypothetical protein
VQVLQKAIPKSKRRERIRFVADGEFALGCHAGDARQVLLGLSRSTFGPRMLD